MKINPRKRKPEIRNVVGVEAAIGVIDTARKNTKNVFPKTDGIIIYSFREKLLTKLHH